MDVKSEEQEILELWNGILRQPDVRKSLVYFWEHRNELQRMEAKVQTLESHVLEILRNLPHLRKHSYEEFIAHCKRLVGHLHNVEPNKEWVRKIQEDLDFLVKEADAAQAKATERIFAKEQAAVEPMLKIIKLVAEYYRTFHLYDMQIIEQGLKSRGLGVLKENYDNLLQRLQVLKGNGQVPMSQEEVRDVFENILSEQPLLKSSNLIKFIIRWTTFFVPRFQLIIEALPRETGLIELSHSDTVSDWFHEYLMEMYASIGAKYYPLKLYRDDLHSSNTESVMHHTQGAYPIQHYEQLAISLKRFFPDIHHGVILRVLSVSYHLDNKMASELKEREWDGVFEFLPM